MSRVWIACGLAVSIAMWTLGCSGDEGASHRSVESWAAELGPAEEFTWDDQPIAFTPPPAGWERQREQSGGLLGARFVKYESGGQAMYVTEFTAVGRRDRCSELEALLRDLDGLGQREFAKRLQRARPYLKDPINRSEARAIPAANARLDEARAAYRDGNNNKVRNRISAALWDLRSVAFSLDEIVEPALFTGEGYEQLGRVEIFEPMPSEVAGEPALALDYLFESRDGRIFRGRQVYVAHNNRLFEAGFQGVAEYLPLFEAMVASISFPAGACEH